MLELKIPPVVAGLVAAGLMWLVAHAMPGYGFDIPQRRLAAQAVAAAGFVIAAWHRTVMVWKCV